MSRHPKQAVAPQRSATRSREEITAAALALIDEEGLEAFSTRKLGAHLGLQAMSLYHYFPNREALLDAAVDRMIGEVLVLDIKRVSWRDGLLQLARDYRAMGHRHLRAIPLLAQRCPASATMQRFLDTLSGLLLKAGLTPVAAADWLVIQRDYVIGSLMADHAGYLLAGTPAAPSLSTTGEQSARLRPNLARKVREHAFEKGLKAMLDAIEREC